MPATTDKDKIAALEQQVRDLQAALADQHQAAEKHAAEQQWFKAVLDYMPAGVYVAEVPSGLPVLVNRFNREVVRRNEVPHVPKEEISAAYSVYLTDTDKLYPTERLPIVRAMAGEICKVDDIEMRFPDGSSRYLEVIGAPLYDEAGKICYSIAITRDITDSHLAKQQVRKEQNFLRGLIQVQERDRQMLAYEIHDGLVQYLTAAVWHLEAMCAKETLPPQATQTLEKSQSLLRNAIADARRVLSGLRPPVLDEHGILAAIDYLVAESQIPGQLVVDANCQVAFRRLHPTLENTLFRIVQEALSNVRRHSGASQARVELTERGDLLELTVTDNGCGFDPKSVPQNRFGLQGIRKRAELLGGQCEIALATPRGTRLTVRLPRILPDATESDSPPLAQL